MATPHWRRSPRATRINLNLTADPSGGIEHQPTGSDEVTAPRRSHSARSYTSQKPGHDSPTSAVISVTIDVRTDDTAALRRYNASHARRHGFLAEKCSLRKTNRPTVAPPVSPSCSPKESSERAAPPIDHAWSLTEREQVSNKAIVLSSPVTSIGQSHPAAIEQYSSLEPPTPIIATQEVITPRRVATPGGSKGVSHGRRPHPLPAPRRSTRSPRCDVASRAPHSGSGTRSRGQQRSLTTLSRDSLSLPPDADPDPKRSVEYTSCNPDSESLSGSEPTRMAFVDTSKPSPWLQYHLGQTPGHTQTATKSPKRVTQSGVRKKGALLDGITSSGSLVSRNSSARPNLQKSHSSIEHGNHSGVTAKRVLKHSRHHTDGTIDLDHLWWVADNTGQTATPADDARYQVSTRQPESTPGIGAERLSTSTSRRSAMDNSRIKSARQRLLGTTRTTHSSLLPARKPPPASFTEMRFFDTGTFVSKLPYHRAHTTLQTEHHYHGSDRENATVATESHPIDTEAGVENHEDPSRARLETTNDKPQGGNGVVQFSKNVNGDTQRLTDNTTDGTRTLTNHTPSSSFPPMSPLELVNGVTSASPESLALTRQRAQVEIKLTCAVGDETWSKSGQQNGTITSNIQTINTPQEEVFESHRPNPLSTSASPEMPPLPSSHVSIENVSLNTSQVSSTSKTNKLAELTMSAYISVDVDEDCVLESLKNSNLYTIDTNGNLMKDEDADGWSHDHDNADKERPSSGVASAVKKTNRKSKRSVRFSVRNEVLEYEPMEPIGPDDLDQLSRGSQVDRT